MGRAPQARSDASRAKLRDAARSLFHLQGYPVTTVAEIADAAGLTKGAFYYHFDSKEQILKDLHDEFLDDHLERGQRVIALDLPAAETLRELIKSLLISIDQHRDSISVFLRDRRFLSPAVAAEVSARRDEYERMITGALDRGIADGTLRSVQPSRLVGFGIMGMCAWAVEWFQPTGALKAEDVADLYSDVLLGGLLTGDASSLRASATGSTTTS